MTSNNDKVNRLIAQTVDELRLEQLVKAAEERKRVATSL